MSDELDEPSDLESDEPYVPKTSGWPMWDLEAEKILSGIRAHIFDPSAIGIVALGQFSDTAFSISICWHIPSGKSRSFTKAIPR
jgi:hypothetical protein